MSDTARSPSMGCRCGLLHLLLRQVLQEFRRAFWMWPFFLRMGLPFQRHSCCMLSSPLSLVLSLESGRSLHRPGVDRWRVRIQHPGLYLWLFGRTRHCRAAGHLLTCARVPAIRGHCRFQLMQCGHGAHLSLRLSSLFTPLLPFRSKLLDLQHSLEELIQNVNY